MRLGTKLRIGFSIPVLMMLAAGSWSLMRFATLSRGVSEMMSENDRSIRASNAMEIALERMDSAALLLVADRTAPPAGFLQQADSTLNATLAVAQSNVSLPEEPAILDSLVAAEAVFRERLAEHLAAPTLEGYEHALFPAFQAVRASAQRLRRVNELAMEQRAIHMAEVAYRAALPAAILMFAAILFTLLFAWLVRYSIVVPLRTVLSRANGLAHGERYASGDIETGDEIQELDAVLGRVDRLRDDPPGA